MSFFGRSNRGLLEAELSRGRLSDSQIAGCDLEGIVLSGIEWNATDMKDLGANGMRCDRTFFSGGVFHQVSLLGSSFIDCALSTMTLEGLTLIKSAWLGTTFRNTRIRLSSLQRARFDRIFFTGSSLVDFEGTYATIENCVFSNSAFEITYGSGMNGFSGASLENCVFHNCRFDGFPLRGATLVNCVFSRCSGEIGDEMDCDNVAGIGRSGFAPRAEITRRADAESLLAAYGGTGK